MNVFKFFKQLTIASEVFSHFILFMLLLLIVLGSREKLNKNNDFVLLASEGRLSLLLSSGPVSGPNLVQGYSASMKITLLNWLFSRQNS